MTTRQYAHRSASTISDNPAVRILARVGFAASGLVHLLLGYLAIRVAFNQQEESDQGGALAEVAKLPGGAIVLWIAVAGLFGLALWLVVEGVLGIGSSSKKRWVRSIVSIGKAAAYLALGITALTFARGGSSDSSDSAQDASATVLSLPGGPILLGIVGVVAVGIGGYFIYKGATRKFTEDLTVPNGNAGRTAVALGVAGYVAKGVAVVTVGILLVVAAVQVDPDDATGFDGALKSLAALPFGIVILTAVGAGLIAYGIYTFVRARYARL
jgi:hypothetical protein